MLLDPVPRTPTTSAGKLAASVREQAPSYRTPNSGLTTHIHNDKGPVIQNDSQSLHLGREDRHRIYATGNEMSPMRLFNLRGEDF